MKQMLKEQRAEKAKARSKSRSFDRSAKSAMINDSASSDESFESFVKRSKETKKGYKKTNWSEIANEILTLGGGKTSLNDEKIVSKYLSSDKIESLKELIEKMNDLEKSETQDDYNDQAMTSLSYDILHFIDDNARIKNEH